MATGYYINQRLCLRSQLCTVRYIGPVSERPGDHIGVEWDDPARGKHDGTYEGVSYFQCRSKSSTAASFLKPTQRWDPPRSFMQALTEKYMNEFTTEDEGTVHFSGKQAEEVGFEKFAKRQQQLHGIHVIVLDGMRIRHDSSGDDIKLISKACISISELDISRNLFETLDEVLDLCKQLPNLRTLTLDGNRFSVEADDSKPFEVLPMIRSLGLSSTLLQSNQISTVCSCFPSLELLTLADNEVERLQLEIPISLIKIDCSNNNMTSLSAIDVQRDHTNLQTVILKHNQISTVGHLSSLTATIKELDVGFNAVSSWKFFDDLDKTVQGLRHLRVSGNLLYKDLKSAEGKMLSPEDGYMLTIARLPQLQTLNYAKITEKERLNAETYYLGQISAQLSSAPIEEELQILAQHPRFKALCEEYGEPNVQRKERGNATSPNSLASHIIDVQFALVPNVFPELKTREWLQKVPKSFSIYSTLGLVAKRLNLTSTGRTPLDLQLILETGEEDPAARYSGYAGPEWWDSDGEDNDVENGKQTGSEGWVKREIELVAGTRMLGTFVDGREARVRIQLIENKD